LLVEAVLQPAAVSMQAVRVQVDLGLVLTLLSVVLSQ
jgi:hypothetical protein